MEVLATFHCTYTVVTYCLLVTFSMNQIQYVSTNAEFNMLTPCNTYCQLLDGHWRHHDGPASRRRSQGWRNSSIHQPRRNVGRK